MISDGAARRIASEWHGGQRCPLLSFATTGMIDDLVQEAVQREIAHLSGNSDIDLAADGYAASARADLEALAAYLEEEGHRTPVAGWSRVWA